MNHNRRSSPSLLLFLLLSSLPLGAVAFSSIAANPPSNYGRVPIEDEQASSTSSAAVVESAPWRITLDIGREPLSRMPFDWARSGCRMPLVVPCDFELNHDNNQQLLLPKSDTVSFTGPDGAVVRPIMGGEWQLTKDNTELTLSLTLPETMARRDVTIDAGTTLELTGRVYTQQELDRLNEEYYQAREATWQVGGELNAIANRQGAAKKWNEETGQWEKRYPNENLFQLAQKQLNYWGAKAKQNQKHNQRPDLNTLSDRGSLPGVDDNGIYIAKGGVVRAGNKGPVMGTWYAQPITTERPVSYRN